MARLGKWGLLALTAAGLVVFAGKLVISKQPAPAAPQPNPFMELFASALPQVEEVLGCKLDALPLFCSADPANPQDDLKAHVHWHFAQLHGDTQTRVLQACQRICSKSTFARYVEGANSIAVTVEHLPIIASWDPELAPVNSKEFLQLALVREVVRWHLDKRYQLNQLRDACRDPEEYDTLHALVEGCALAVTRQVAARLGTQALFPLLAKCDLHVPDDATDPAIKAVSQTALHARYRAGTKGLAFWDALDIPDAEARVFAHLPRQMTVLARPDRWLEAQARNQPDLATVLQSLESALPAGEWQPTQQTWTPTMLVQVTGMLGAPKERAEKIAKSWYEGRSLIWTNRGRPDRQVALSVVRHDGDAGARAYFGFAVDLQRKQDTLPPGTCGPMMCVVESKSVAMKLDGVDEAVLNSKQIAFADAPPIPVCLYLARSGNLVIECTWHGQTADAALGEQLVKAVIAAAR